MALEESGADDVPLASAQNAEPSMAQLACVCTSRQTSSLFHHNVSLHRYLPNDEKRARPQGGPKKEKVN
jgi:hypothetical protein